MCFELKQSKTAPGDKMVGVRVRAVFCITLSLLSYSLVVKDGFAAGKKSDSLVGREDPKQGTRIDEILKWENLSDQYVLGYGYSPEKGGLEPFAIYDKMFETPFYRHFWSLLLLGSLGINDLNLANLAHFFSNAPSLHSNPTSLASFQILELKAKELYLKPVRLSKNFWLARPVIWKKGRQPALERGIPTRIFFDDLDWDAMGRNDPKIKKAFDSFKKARHLLNHNEELPLILDDDGPDNSLSNESLTNLEFQLQKDGTYHLIELPEKPVTARPVKVVDLRKKYSSFNKAIAWASLTNIIKGGINAIPVYGPPHLAVALLERTFDFIELLYLHRHSQAQELILEALDGNRQSPFSTPKISQTMLKDGLFYLLRSNSMLSAVFGNLFKKNETLVDSYIKGINTARDKGLENLLKNGMEVYPLNHTYFALGIKREPATGKLLKVKIYCLPYAKLARPHRPFAAFDFLHPEREVVKRNILQGILTGANFIYTPFPAVATIIKMIYKEVIIREHHKRQMWENGLLAHLRHFPFELQSLLSLTLSTNRTNSEQFQKLAIEKLEQQRLNPLDLRSADIPAHLIKVDRWLIQRDPTYVSWKELSRAESIEINPLNGDQVRGKSDSVLHKAPEPLPQ